MNNGLPHDLHIVWKLADITNAEQNWINGIQVVRLVFRPQTLELLS